jgi:hypothetical protein
LRQLAVEISGEMGRSGDWSGWDGEVAAWLDGAWMRLPPRPGWCARVETEAVLLVRTGADWVWLDAAMGLVTLSVTTRLAAAEARD